MPIGLFSRVTHPSREGFDKKILEVAICREKETNIPLVLIDSDGKESACNAGDSGSIPGSGRSTGEGISYPLQYSWASLVAQLVRIHLQCMRHGFDLWVRKIPWRRKWQSTPVFLSG